MMACHKDLPNFHEKATYYKHVLLYGAIAELSIQAGMTQLNVKFEAVLLFDLRVRFRPGSE